MGKVVSSRGSVLRQFLVFFIVSSSIVLLTLFYLDRAAVFSLNVFTGYKLTYDSWGPHFFDRSRIEKMRLDLTDKRIVIDAGEVLLDLRKRQLFFHKRLVLNCSMKDVLFIDEGEKKPNILSLKDLRDSIIGSDVVYDHITFSVMISGDMVKISNFKAVSRDIRIEGDRYVYYPSMDKVAIDVKISFSPEIVKKFPETVMGAVLSPDEDGWYSAIVNYEGPAVLLKAL